MEYAAVVHFADKRYAYALEKGKVLFKLETKKGDMKRVVLHHQDKYIPLSYKDTRDSIVMQLSASDKYKDYYTVELDFSAICLRYFFELEDQNGLVKYYGNHEFYDGEMSDVECMFDCPQNLREEEIFDTPKWAKNKVVYQVFPSSFASSMEVPEEEWYQTPLKHGTKLHGDLKGITKRLPYLKELGVDVVYMTPIFKSSSNHKYNTEDYYMVDPEFGTKEDLCELVNTAHKLDLRVVLDGVFNHTGADFFAFLDVLNNQESSKYKDWYYINEFPVTRPEGYHMREKPKFQTFSYFWGMPKLNLSNPEVQDFVIDVAKYWVRECGIDGWRLDVADEISHSFWKRFRKEMKEFNRNLLIVGEIWHFAGDFLEGDEWDSVMNYQFFQSVMGLVATESMTVSEYVARQDFMRANVNKKVVPLLWNLMGSHDTPRFYNCCNKNEKKSMLGAAFMLLNPGMPMIYYGDEVGMEGAKDPDCRRGMLWDEKRQNQTVLEWYRSLLRLRKELPSLTEGVVTKQAVDDEQGLLLEERVWKDKVVNVAFHCKKGKCDVPELKNQKNLITGQMNNGSLGDYEVMVY